MSIRAIWLVLKYVKRVFRLWLACSESDMILDVRLKIEMKLFFDTECLHL